MIAKIVRITLVMMLVVVLAMVLPRLYRKVFEKPTSDPEIVYSEILDDFLLVSQNIDPATKKYSQIAVDTKGKEYDKKEIEALTPVRSFNQLEYQGRFPDSICGRPVTLNMVAQSFTFPQFLGIRDKQRSPLLWMYESQSGGDKLQLPDDVFRIGNNGIEFVDIKSNKTDQSKSKLFNDVLLKTGFTPPSKIIFGVTNMRKSVDRGYFAIDSGDGLYHIMMANGKPICARVPLPDGVKPLSMSCFDGEIIYGYLFDTNLNIYLLRSPGYELVRLPIDDYAKFNGMMVVESNMFYTTVTQYGPKSKKTYILDSDYKLKKSYELATTEYQDSPVAQREAYIFPISFKKDSSGLDFKFAAPSKFLYLNLTLMLVLLIIKIVNRRRVINIFNIIDLLTVGLFGIFGFIAVLVFPNRK